MITNKITVLQNAINILSNQYEIDRDFMEDYDKIKWLETITDLTKMYFLVKDNIIK
jgi:hypothetical protein